MNRAQLEAEFTALAQDQFLTQKRLRELLFYNSETGDFMWLVSRGGVSKGTIAGTISHGYVLIRIDGIYYRAHRLAWLYMTGEWPADEIDHINRDKSYNAWCNLREATKSENMINGPPQKRNHLQVKGVRKRKNRPGYYARLGQIYIGVFPTIVEAQEAYKQKATELFGEFGR